MLLLLRQGFDAVSDYQSLHSRIHRIRIQIRLPSEPDSVLPDGLAAGWQGPTVQLAAVLQPVADAFAAAAAFAFAFAAFAASAASAAVVEQPGQLVAFVQVPEKQEPAAQQHRVVPASYPHSG